MTQFLLSMPHDSAEEPTMATMDPAELEAVMALTGVFLEELAASGALVFAGGLHPPSTAVTVDHTGADLALVDGPYTQAPEYLGGLWVVAAPDQDLCGVRSLVDDIEIVHTAHNRKGFAEGAVLAAEFLFNKTGIFTMKDVLGV